MASFCEHGNAPLGACYFLKSGVTSNFSKNVLHHGVS
jgi:hypothetical protein